MIDIDSGTLSIESTQLEPIKVPFYLMLCRDCQIEAKNNERNMKLKKILRRNLIQRIKFMIR
jgi:hypothetical protein